MCIILLKLDCCMSKLVLAQFSVFADLLACHMLAIGAGLCLFLLACFLSFSLSLSLLNIVQSGVMWILYALHCSPGRR